MPMTLLAKGIGILLALLGIAGYLLTGGESITALIPAIFGIILFVLGYAGQSERLRKHVMHAAALVALIGLVGSVQGIFTLVSLAGGEEAARPGAAVAQSIMALLCLVFIIFAVRSFIQSRKG